MKKQIQLTSLALAGAIGLSVAAPMAAEAGSAGRRNTAIGLGALGVYGIVTKKPLVAGLGVGGAVYSYMSSREAAKKERARRASRIRHYRSRYVYSKKYHRYVRVR